MKLRELRKNIGLKQCQVAKALGISPQIYSRYERNEREPSIDMLIQMADFFDISIDALIGHTVEQQLFDDARIERTELLELFDQLSPMQQEHVMFYVRGMTAANNIAGTSKINSK